MNRRSFHSFAVVALGIAASPLLACSSADDLAATNSANVVGESCRLAAATNHVCASVFEPVCGCDGKTYGNDCEAARVVTASTPGACNADGPGEGRSDAGACKLATPTNHVCPSVFEPVCGCDGKTYGNDCEAARVVTASTPGACNADGGAAHCKLATPTNHVCPSVFEPVCGCDGKTYGNDCEAARVVTGSTPGACKP